MKEQITKMQIKETLKDLISGIRLIGGIYESGFPGGNDLVMEVVAEEVNGLRRNRQEGCNAQSRETMTFGEALEAMKRGGRLARKGWNGTGMFLYYVPADAYPPKTDAAKEAFGGEPVPYSAYIAMKTAQGYVVPWLASQTDMLADDWYMVE